MSTVDIDGRTFVVGKLNARQQFHVARRLAPVIAAVIGGDGLSQDSIMNSMATVATSIADLKDVDADYIMDTCLGVVKFRDDEAGKDFPIMVGKSFRYDWVDLPLMMKLAAEVIKDNLAGFMSAVPSSSPEPATA